MCCMLEVDHQFALLKIIVQCMYVTPAQPEIMEGCQNRGAKKWNSKQHFLPYAFITELLDREGVITQR